MRLLAFTCGWLTGPATLFLDGQPGTLRVPVPCFLVDHPRGKVLFDSGLHPDVARDPRARLGELAASVFHAEYATGEDVASRLAAADVEVRDVRFLVNSHLHFDHAGGNACVPGATVVVQRREWEAGRDAAAAAANHFDARDYETGQPVRLVDGEHDLFGDGRVVCLPTFGHTPGHQSLRVRLDGGDVVLTSNACYLRRTLEALHLPAIVADRDAMLASLARLRALRDRGARLVYGHDADEWARVPATLS